MSRDIRSFFTTISKKVVSTEKNKPTKSTLNTSDIIPDTPDDAKKHKKPSKNSTGSKRKRIVVVDSDSESEEDVKPLKTPKKEPLKERKIKTPPKAAPVNTRKTITPFEAFSSTPIKQDKVHKETEINIHNDDDFERTLLELDEEELLRKVDNGSIKNNVDVKVACEVESSPQKKVEKTPNRKRKMSSGNEEDNGSVNTDEERYERKRHSAMLYQKYLNRSGPIHLGTKWTPKGKADCLKGLCFIITGVLESLEREQAETLIKEHGGRCTTGVSGKVNYMVLGDDAGPAKVEKARKLGTKIISEDDLIDLICVKSGITNENMKQPDTSTSQHVEKKQKLVLEQVKETQQCELKNEKVDTTNKLNVKKEEIKLNNAENVTYLQWVDKYKPKDLKEIIGQQGERSNVKKLTNWLNNWQKSRARESVGKGIPRPSPWSKDDDAGAFFRAALLSGSPGVGKTTTATLVCKQLGYDTVEFNASDTRNKKMVHNEVAQIINTTSLAGFFNDGSAPSRRHVLLMDEVDGMSGNEDRGGIQELITIIKTTNIPIICMCNDRQHPKIRTLANYCFDLRFSKPRLEQIRGAMMSICFKEGIKMKADTLTHIIQGTGQDIRQTLNQLALYSAKCNVNDDNKQSIEKDVKLGPWEVIRKVFSEEEHKNMSLIDKSKLFFHDYSIGPLFVQENYLKVVPHCPKKDQLERFASAADAISMGDIVDSRIRSSQNWALLDLQSMYASVLPGHYLEGHFGGQIDFPGWLGKNSKANKFKRMLSEINAHTRMNISGDRIAIGLDYVQSLRDAVANPMLKKGSDGIQESVAVMRAYNLLREDLTSLVELAHWPKSKDPFDGVDSKIKAAFTRAYNKEAPALPYAAPGTSAVKSKRGTTAANDADDPYNEYDDADEGDEPNEEDDNISNDAMIKTKKASSKPTTSSSKEKASASKGKTTKTSKEKSAKGKGASSKRGTKK